MGNAPCPVCKRPDQQVQSDGLRRDMRFYSCKTCGEFGLSGTAEVVIQNIPDDQRYLASAILREMRPSGGPPVELTSYDLDTLQDRRRAPRTLAEKFDRIGRLLERKQERVGATTFVEVLDDYPLAYALDQYEFRAMLTELQERGYMALQAVDKRPNTVGVRLNPKGYDWIDQHRVGDAKKGNLVFVAMAFDDPYKVQFEPGVRAACEALGYTAEPLYRDESNEMWMDRILTRIRESRFIVADLSEHRGGVYFEAGYALGRDLPVIFTCKDDRFDLKERVHPADAQCEAKTERPVAHSDAKNWTVIRWASTEDLTKKLESRIGRAVGRFEPAK